MDDVTRATDVALPIEYVELTRMKTVSGAPVRVGVEFIAEERLVDLVRGLPGATAPVAGQPEPDEEKAAREMLRYAAPVIEATTFLQGDDALIRPAFSWADPVPAGSIPGRYLSAHDRGLLFEAAMRVCGWTGDTADAVSFPERPRGDDGGGGDAGHGAGVGAVDAGLGNGDATLDAAAGPEPFQPTPTTGGVGG
jgi:hypothetical protein